MHTPALLFAFAAFIFHGCLQAQQADASATASPQPLAAIPVVDADYTIREGDMVQMTVFNEPELAVNGRVRKDGTLQCPLIGQTRIAGLTQQVAARLVAAAYQKDYLVNPEVNLFVAQFSVQRVTVLGQVLRPGSIELPAEKQLSILQVLGMAGGPTRIASLKRVTVKRNVNGRQETIKLDVQSLIKGGDSQLFYVQEDDVITVPESLF